MSELALNIAAVLIAISGVIAICYFISREPIIAGVLLLGGMFAVLWAFAVLVIWSVSRITGWFA